MHGGNCHRNVVFYLACVIFGLIYIFIKPVQRGFFCDDTSIQYPFRQDTIPMWVLALYGGVGPIIIVGHFIFTINQMGLNF